MFEVSATLFSTARTQAVQYLESQLSSVSDPYALSIIAYALSLANSSQAYAAFQNLSALAISEDGLKYWHKNVSADSPPGMWRSPYRRARSVDIEMTAYALLTYTRRRDFAGAVPIVKWIVSQRNSRGGFSSTQDTVVALQALAEYAALTSGNNAQQNLAITVTADTLSHSFTINADNALVLQSVQIPSSATTVSLQANGSGVGLVQLNVKFYYYGSTWRQATSRQSIELEVNQQQIDDEHIIVRSCARWLGSEVSGMVIMDIRLLTGHVANNVDQLRSQSSLVKRVDSDESKIVLYLDELTANSTCITVMQTMTLIVDKLKPAFVTSYRYYDVDSYATHVYQALTLVNSTWCDRCPSCCQCNPPGFFQCSGGNGTCLSINKKCDNVSDCADSSDEMDCSGGIQLTASAHLLMWLIGVAFIISQLLTG